MAQRCPELARHRRCQVALLVIDAQEGLTDQDTRLVNYIYRMGKGSLILVNKADLVGERGRNPHSLNAKLRSASAGVAGVQPGLVRVGAYRSALGAHLPDGSERHASLSKAPAHLSHQ